MPQEASPMGSRPSSETVPEPPSLLRMQNGDPSTQLSRSLVRLGCSAIAVRSMEPPPSCAAEGPQRPPGEEGGVPGPGQQLSSQRSKFTCCERIILTEIRPCHPAKDLETIFLNRRIVCPVRRIGGRCGPERAGEPRRVPHVVDRKSPGAREVGDRLVLDLVRTWRR